MIFKPFNEEFIVTFKRYFSFIFRDCRSKILKFRKKFRIKFLSISVKLRLDIFTQFSNNH